MKSHIITVIVILLIFGGLFAWSSAVREGNTATPGENAPGAASVVAGGLIASETLYDFGTISMKNGNVTKEFTITNPTGADITVATVQTSCMCTTAFVVRPDGSLTGPFGMPGMSYVPPADEVIKAGESRVIRVVYDPNAHGPAGVGSIDRFVTLTEVDGGALRLEILALVTP